MKIPWGLDDFFYFLKILAHTSHNYHLLFHLLLWRCFVKLILVILT